MMIDDFYGVPVSVYPPLPGHYYKFVAKRVSSSYTGKIEKFNKDYYISDFKFISFENDTHPLRQNTKTIVVPVHFIESEEWLYEYTPTLLPEVSKIIKDVCKTCYKPGKFVRMALMCEDHGLIGGC